MPFKPLFGHFWLVLTFFWLVLSHLWPYLGLSGAILWPFWGRDHFRVILDHFWVDPGSFWGSIRRHFGVTLESFGIVLASFWGRFGLVFTPFWGLFCTLLGPFLDHLAHFLAIITVILRFFFWWYFAKLTANLGKMKQENAKYANFCQNSYTKLFKNKPFFGYKTLVLL